MSYSLKNLYAASPVTTRGKPLHLGSDPKNKKNFLYATGASVFMRDLKNPLIAEMYTEHQVPPTVARYAPSGFYIASGDNSGTIRIWDTTQKEHILKVEVKAIGGPIYDLQWSDDSKRVVAVGEGKEKMGTVFMWDTGSSVGEISGHSKAILSCDFKQTRPYRIATGSEDNQTNWYEGPPFKFKMSLKEQSKFVNCVRFSPDGNFLVTVSSDKTICLYDGKSGDLVRKFAENDGHKGGIYSVAWSPDSKKVVTASADKTCKLWNVDTGACEKTFTFSNELEDQQLGCLWQENDVISVALSGDIYYLDLNNPSKPHRIIRGHNKFINTLAYDKGNNRIITADFGGKILSWDPATGNTEVFTGNGHTNMINKIQVQGGKMVTVSKDDSLRITPLSSRAYGDATPFEGEPFDVAVGKKDEKLQVVANVNSVVVLRDGKIVNKHPVKFQPSSIALSVDELLVAVGGKDNIIHFFSLSGDKLNETKELKKHRGPITSLNFSPDGQRLVSCDTNRDIFVWNVKSGECEIAEWTFHTARVNSVQFAPDSVHIVSASLDSHLFVWDIQNPKKRIHIKDAHRGGVDSAIWIDGNTIASVGQDCTMKTWTVTFH